MSTQDTTQPLAAPNQPGRTHPCNIGSYLFLCRTGTQNHPKFTYSHVQFGTVVWHK